MRLQPLRRHRWSCRRGDRDPQTALRARLRSQTGRSGRDNNNCATAVLPGLRRTDFPLTYDGPETYGGPNYPRPSSETDEREREREPTSREELRDQKRD